MKNKGEQRKINKSIEEKKLPEVFTLIRRSVVLINIVRKTPFLEDDKMVIKDFNIGHGSGFIYNIGDLAFVFTAAHIVTDLKKEDRIEVIAPNKRGEWVKDSKVQIFFADEEHDIAALLLSHKAVNFQPVNLPAPAFDLEMVLKVGVMITYCGFPYISRGKYIPVFQQGMIAGIDTGRFKDDKIAYVIDGMVNPGNSGGPAFYGKTNEVIGIISAYIKPLTGGPRLAIIDGRSITDLFSRSAGLGLVVPINYAIDALKMEIGKIKRKAKRGEDKKKSLRRKAKEVSSDAENTIREVISGRIVYNKK